MACNPEKIEYAMRNYEELVNEVEKQKVTN